MTFRSLLSLLGVIFTLPLLALVFLAFSLPVTSSGFGYLLGCALAVTGFILTPWGGRYSLVLVVVGMVLIVFIAGGRLVLAAREESSGLRLVTLPQGTKTRWINAIIDEQDSLIFGEAIFHRIGGDSPMEHEKLTEALRTAYSDIRAKHLIIPSPFLSTYLGLQQPGSFDTLIIQPNVRRRPETAVIFLHGYMGNVTAQCYEIAQATSKLGFLTVCPSTHWTGTWWQPDGQAILQSTFQYLREQEIKTFYLGGFSNGGFGISRLTPTLRSVDELAGLFFINGITNGAQIRELGLPILILQGTQDERVPATVVRPTAESIGDSATYVEIEGDHFMIMKQPEAVQAAIEDWLKNQPAQSLRNELIQ